MRITRTIRRALGEEGVDTPNQAGTFPCYCCLETGAAADTQRGRLVVTE